MWRAYFPVAHHLSFSRESHRRAPLSRARAYLSKDSFDQSTSAGLPAEEKPDCQARYSRTWVTWRRIGRRFIARSCTTCTTTTAAVHPTGCEIRSLMIDESRTNVTSSLNALLSFAIVDVRSSAETSIFVIIKNLHFFCENVILDVKGNTKWLPRWHHFCRWIVKMHASLDGWGNRKLKTLAFSKIESRKGEARRGNFRDGRKIMMIFIPNEISPAASESAGIDIVPWNYYNRRRRGGRSPPNTRTGVTHV